jgi:hypothetical protein
MAGYDLFPDDFVAKYNGFKEGQSGLFYDPSLKCLIVGKISDYKLKGRVVHNGLTQKDIDDGRYFYAFSTGYSYGDWCKHDMFYAGKLRNYTSLAGYLEYIEKADLEAIKIYFKVKDLLLDNKSI